MLLRDKSYRLPQDCTNEFLGPIISDLNVLELRFHGHILTWDHIKVDFSPVGMKAVHFKQLRDKYVNDATGNDDHIWTKHSA